MTTFADLPTWVCLGDSLTHNPPGSPTNVLNPWPGRIDLELWPERGAANAGHTGTRLATNNVNGVSMREHFDADIDGQGFYGMVLWGGVNDVIADATGAATFADFKALIDDALAQGMKVIACITSPAAGYTGGWSAGRQTALEEFRAAVLALIGTDDSLEVVDFYSLMGDPAAPTFLEERWKGVADDGLHHGDDAHTEVVIPALLPLMRAGEAVEAVDDGLQANALTTLATLRTELAITDETQDEILARLINGASDSIEKYCDRSFGYTPAVVEKVAGYGTEILHVDRSPVWEVDGIEVDGQAVSPDDFNVRDNEVGSIWSGTIWPHTAPMESSVSPHRRVGFEERSIQVTYAGGYALPSDDRVASDCPEWVALGVYDAGDKVTLGGRVYKSTTGGRAGSNGPSGMGDGIVDGAVIWEFLCPAYPLPADLEEACLQLATYRFRRRGRDPSLTSEQIGRTSRQWGAMGPAGIPKAITDILDGYARVR